MLENPLSCLIVGIIIGVAGCYAVGIIRFDMRIRVSRHKKTFTVQQDDMFSQVERDNLKFMRYLVETDRVSDHIQ